MTSSSSCASFVFCARRNTMNSSRAIQPGSLNRLAAWATMAGRSSPKPAFAICRRSTTLVRRRSQI